MVHRMQRQASVYCGCDECPCDLERSAAGPSADDEGDTAGQADGYGEGGCLKRSLRSSGDERDVAEQAGRNQRDSTADGRTSARQGRRIAASGRRCCKRQRCHERSRRTRQPPCCCPGHPADPMAFRSSRRCGDERDARKRPTNPAGRVVGTANANCEVAVESADWKTARTPGSAATRSALVRRDYDGSAAQSRKSAMPPSNSVLPCSNSIHIFKRAEQSARSLRRRRRTVRRVHRRIHDCASQRAHISSDELQPLILPVSARVRTRRTHHAV